MMVCKDFKVKLKYNDKCFKTDYRITYISGIQLQLYKRPYVWRNPTERKDRTVHK